MVILVTPIISDSINRLVMILNSLFYNDQYRSPEGGGGGGGGGGTPGKNRGVRPASQNPYPISDLTKSLIPYFRPDPNDEKIASFRKHAQFKTRVHKPYPISDQNGSKTIPLGPHIPI